VSERDALLKEVDLLRVLASMGLAVGQFTHEFSTLSGAMRADLVVLTEKDRSDLDRDDAARSLKTLLDQARSFSGLFKAMTEENALRERRAIDLYEATTAFSHAMRSILERNGVDFEISDDGAQIFTPPMHRSELFAILLNLTTNSIKAIKRARRRGKIMVRLSNSVDESAVLDFLDNGDGIAPEVRETMFDAFVTTTAATGSAVADEDLALGSGLGLTIVRDIVTALAGTVGVSAADSGFATCLRIELPLFKEAS
jgi:signal transduction histidine kinase